MIPKRKILPFSVPLSLLNQGKCSSNYYYLPLTGRIRGFVSHFWSSMKENDAKVKPSEREIFKSGFVSRFGRYWRVVLRLNSAKCVSRYACNLSQHCRAMPEMLCVTEEIWTKLSLRRSRKRRSMENVFHLKNTRLNISSKSFVKIRLPPVAQISMRDNLIQILIFLTY